MVSENKKNKNPKIKSFFFFLLLATVFWFLSKFSKDAEANLTTTINYINIPDTVIVTNDNAKEISFDVSGNGFQLLAYKLRKSTLDIDISKYYTESENSITISTQEIQKLVLEQLKLPQIKNLSDTELTLHLDRNASKKLPIVLKSQISYKEGFFKQGEIIIKPDSVNISGPSEAIDSITSIQTVLLKRNNISEGFTTAISLEKPQVKNVVLDTETVEVVIQVEEFSQMNMEIPIEVVNLPEDTELKLFPESIKITFDISIKDFGHLDVEDFKITCDYATRIEEGSFMIPKLVKSPEVLQHIELETKKVAYLIFK